MEIWDILDGEGKKTGKTIIRGQELKDGDYHLVVHIWILNDKGEFLIQRRAEHLRLLPGLWAATGGSAVAGEDGKTAAIREVKEELGIDVDTENMIKLKTMKRRNNFAEIWLVKQNISLRDVHLQAEEVSGAKWVTKEELENMIKSGGFHNYGEDYFKDILALMK
ncbi:NUDIX domain-containing protein [Clostridium swellfunianum]|uniref:NUDIX hydrolase n=1 Tax=Clostridium swellfunianum TaxID=1367462 RepID=UPI00202E4DF6|nr:NUDIX domain-containing protein [Clostridium swellfunianum]MCM0649117.1 NUDIX domain-containing protein [Clostridium swellfunianum]